ncbi:MAG: flagellar assembly protein FliW [Myxococcales bacterium]|nr:flagellar assembly protein FliW [Myxococcales bacterium]
MRIVTPRFGELEIPEETIVFFPEGLPGFKSRHWVVFVRDETPMIEWLQSVDEPEIALMTMDPVRDLLLDYSPEPKAGELNPISVDSVHETTIRIIIRNADSPGRLSINLFAPLFYNAPQRLGMQLPLVGSGFQVSELWPPEEIVAMSPSGGVQTSRTSGQSIEHNRNQDMQNRACE